jgi:ATP-dependent RNA helicase RhlE
LSFSDLGLAGGVLRAITTAGYEVPTPIQAAAIPAILNGRDVLGCAQTGTGKTAAFCLPLVQRLVCSQPHPGKRRLPRALIVVPTRELACQVGDSIVKYGKHSGLRHVLIFGGVSQVPQVRYLQQGVDIIVATPGRLVDLIQQGFCDLSRIEILVLDEADRMFDMGFAPDVRRIVEQMPPERQNLLFSATMPREIEALADAVLRDPERIRIAHEHKTEALVQQRVIGLDSAAKLPMVLHLLGDPAVDSVILFTRTKHRADMVCKKLGQQRIRAAAIHGNKTQNNRQRVLHAFKTGQIRVLVATDVASRGIDIAGLAMVINYDVPTDPETYVHRIGRTGRAGAMGQAVTLCGKEERGLMRGVERLLGKRLGLESPPQGLVMPAAQGPAEEMEMQGNMPRDGRGMNPPHQGGYQNQGDHPNHGGHPNQVGEGRPFGRKPFGKKPFGKRPFGKKPFGNRRPQAARP